MGGRRRRRRSENDIDATAISQTLPSSPAHSFSSSSSSSDFEFRISSSPCNNKLSSSSPPLSDHESLYCPADDLFYKGQLLPLQLSPRLSMLQSLLLTTASNSSSSSSTTSTCSSSPRDSTGSSNDSSSITSSTTSFYSDLVLLPEFNTTVSSRPSSITDEDDQFNPLRNLSNQTSSTQQKKSKYFSFSRLFRKDHHQQNKNIINKDDHHNIVSSSSSSVKRNISTSAKEVIMKYMKKVKPLICDKLSQKQQQNKIEMIMETKTMVPERPVSDRHSKKEFSHSFSGNVNNNVDDVMYPRRSRRCVSSCPSSIRSSPSRSYGGNGVLRRNNAHVVNGISHDHQYYFSSNSSSSSSSSMEELQNAIQGAIAHCKNSMIQNNNAHQMGKEI